MQRPVGNNDAMKVCARARVHAYTRAFLRATGCLRTYCTYGRSLRAAIGVTGRVNYCELVWGNVETNGRVEEWKVAGQFVGTNLERPGRGKECRRCRWPWTCLSKRSQLCKIASRMTRHDVILLCDDSRNLFGNPLTLTNDDTLLCCPFRRIAWASELGCCLPKS